MAFGRLFVGAVVGAAIGAAVWVLVQYFTETEFEWLAIGVGVLAGLFAKGAAGQAKLGYARGAVPVVATLLFIILVHYALFAILQKTGGVPKQASLMDVRNGASAESGSDNADMSGGPDLSAELVRGSTGGATQRGPRRAKDPFSWETFIWVGIAALVAYVLGGSDPTDAEVPSEEPTTAAEPTADETGESTEEPPAAEEET